MIVVTGGAGFIGSVLARALNEAGEEALLIVDQGGQKDPKRQNLEKVRHALYLESDAFLSRLESGEWNKKIRALFHMGACSDTTEKDTAFLKKNNTLYSERLARWAVDRKVYFAYASSAATYGAGEHGYTDDDALTAKLNPLNPYGQSKLAFDQWVLEEGLQKKITGFRFFNVYGPNEYHKRDMRSMVHKGFEQVRDQGVLRLFKSYRPEYPDGGQKRDFVYVKDVVDAMLWFYGHPHVTGIFNMGQGKAETWNDLAAALFATSGKPPHIDYIPMPENIRNQYQYFTEADLTKLRASGCPTVFRSLRDGVADYVRHHLLTPDPHY